MHAVRGEGDVTRHWIFVAVDAALAALLVLRPRWAFFAAIALGAQQMYGHGLALARSFNGDVPLDTWSLVVCLYFPTLVTMLFLERQEEKEARERAEEEGASRAP